MNKEQWIKRALQKGIEAFEIYQSVQTEKSITWFDGHMDTMTTSHVLGTSIRGIYDGNMANIAMEEVNDDQMDDVLDELIDQAKVITTKDKDVLRKPESFDDVESPKDWVAPTTDDIKDCLMSLEKELLAYDPRVIQVASLGWEESTSSREITNSYGMHVADQTQVQYLVASVVVRENDVIKDDYQIEIIENLNQFDHQAFVKKLCDKALFKLHATSLKSGEYPVIFSYEAMTSLFGSFVNFFNGDLIYKGISPIKDKLNERIFSNKITIIDDPQNTDCLTIANFDDEGCPTRAKVLVNDGIFANMLHDTKSGNRMGMESTGNGFKSGYAGAVSVQPMNCYIEPGQYTLDELCEQMKDGVVITDLQGLHAGLDFVSGNFSLQASGYTVKDGKKDHALALITVADNFLELMNKVVEVGNDLDWQYHQVASTSIRFTKCAISGQ